MIRKTLAVAALVTSIAILSYACHETTTVVDGSCEAGASDAEAGTEAAAGDAGPCDGELYLHEFAEATGAHLVSCCANVGVTVDPEHAEYVFEAGWLGQSFAGVEGRACSLTFDAAKGADCLAKVSSMTCQDISESEYHVITASCFAGVYTGNVPDGGACDVSVQCGNNSFCDHTAGDGGSQGICAPVASEGSPCVAYNPAHEFSCSHLGNGRACVGGVCIPLRAPGAAIQTTPLECSAGMVNASYACADVIPIATFPNFTAGICSVL